MIKDHQKELNRIHIVLDAIFIALSYVVAWYMVLGRQSTSSYLPTRVYFMVLIVIIPFYLVLNAFFDMYTPKRSSGRRAEVFNIIKVNTVGMMVFMSILFLGSKNLYIYHYSRRVVAYFYILSIVFETIEKYLLRLFLRNIRKQGFNQKHILLVGYSKAAEGFIDRVRQNPQWGYSIKGILDNYKKIGSTYREVSIIGPLDKLGDVLSENALDEIAITLGLSEYADLEPIVRECDKSGVHTKFIPDYQYLIPTIPYMEDLSGLPVINIRHVPLTQPHNAIVKRVIDIFGAICAIIIFSPIMLITAILIKATSKGPIIFSQERVGLHNKPFRMYKFRSMECEPEEKEKTQWTKKHDPRVTRVGRIIRKTSIDEFPQFFNVLWGDMSLVGPRPERPFFVEKFKEEIPHYMIKHQVRPGVTGWAQVNGYRGDTSIKKRIEYDLYYIENWTLAFDIKILCLTLVKGFINKNAY